MKKSLTFSALTIAFLMSSCKSTQVPTDFQAFMAYQQMMQQNQQQNIQNQQQQQQTSGNPFGDVYEAPCTVYDTNEEFAATGIFRGSMYQKGEVHKFALQNAQSLVRMKIKHAYKAIVSDYSSSTGNNAGNDIERKVTEAGDQIIDTVINNTSECCVKFSSVGDDGHIECYVAIKIPKNDLSEKIAKEVSNKLSDDEKMRINFNEAQYREQMKKRFEQYQEENK